MKKDLATFYYPYMVENDSKKLLKVAPLFFCKKCDYNTSKKSSYYKHLTTDKHKKGQNDSEKLLKVAKLVSYLY